MIIHIGPSPAMLWRGLRWTLAFIDQQSLRCVDKIMRWDLNKPPDHWIDL